ncbi:MAG: hypothetical protein U0231_12270 [Nitrospiraceae bacterium]
MSRSATSPRLPHRAGSAAASRPGRRLSAIQSVVHPRFVHRLRDGAFICCCFVPARLRIRAVTQNRSMSACLGIPTRAVDAYTFAFGSGLAGVAGWALTLVGNVEPGLGQNYIVDSFMVVVTGGVGKLAGTIIASLGIGGLNKLLEPSLGAVFGKVIILMLVILFLQRRPSGLFAVKGRHADA